MNFWETQFNSNPFPQEDFREGSYTFLLIFLGQNLVSWPHLAARDAWEAGLQLSTQLFSQKSQFSVIEKKWKMDVKATTSNPHGMCPTRHFSLLQTRLCTFPQTPKFWILHPDSFAHQEPGTAQGFLFLSVIPRTLCKHRQPSFKPQGPLFAKVPFKTPFLSLDFKLCILFL